MFGGQDMKEGPYNSLWSLDLEKLSTGKGVAWE